MTLCFLLNGHVTVPSGSYRVVYEYANECNARGIRVFIAYIDRCLSGQRSGPKASLRRSYHRALWSAGLRRWFPLASGVKELYVKSAKDLDGRQIDMYIAGCWRTGEWMRSSLGQLRRTAMLVHHYEAELFPDIASSVLPALVDPGILKLCVSTYTYNRIKQLGSSTCVVVPNGLEQNLYSSGPEAARLPYSAAFNFVDRTIKDPTCLVNVLWRLFRLHPESQLIGFGLKQPSAELPPNVSFLRRPKDTEVVAKVYRRSQVFVSTSRLEGFGFTVLEAAACGCVPVVTDCGGISDFAISRSSALVLPVGDVDGLAEGVSNVWTDGALRLSLRDESLRLASGFSWKLSAVELIRVIRQHANIS